MAYFSKGELQKLQKDHEKKLADQARIQEPQTPAQVIEFENVIRETYALFEDMLKEYPALLKAYGKKFSKTMVYPPQGSRGNGRKMRIYSVGIPFSVYAKWGYTYCDSRGRILYVKIESRENMHGPDFVYFYRVDFGLEEMLREGRKGSYYASDQTVCISVSQYVNRAIDNAVYYYASFAYELEQTSVSTDEDHYWTYRSFRLKRRRSQKETVEQIKQHLIRMASG